MTELVRAFLLDDDLDFLTETAAYLRDAELEIHHDHRPLLAHRQIARFRPQVVSIDLDMPGASGFQVLERLRRTPGLHRIPVLLATAHDNRALRLEGFERGLDDFLAKPVDLEELALRLRALARRSPAMHAPLLEEATKMASPAVAVCLDWPGAELLGESKDERRHSLNRLRCLMVSRIAGQMLQLAPCSFASELRMLGGFREADRVAIIFATEARPSQTAVIRSRFRRLAAAAHHASRRIAADNPSFLASRNNTLERVAWPLPRLAFLPVHSPIGLDTLRDVIDTAMSTSDARHLLVLDPI